MKHAALLVALLTIALLVAACGRRTAVDPVDTASATTTTASVPEPADAGDPAAQPVDTVDGSSTTTTAAAAEVDTPTTTTAAPATTAASTSTAPPASTTTTTTAPDNSAAITAAEDALAQAEALLDGLRSDSDAIAGDLAADADAQAQG